MMCMLRNPECYIFTLKCLLTPLKTYDHLEKMVPMRGVDRFVRNKTGRTRAPEGYATGRSRINLQYSFFINGYFEYMVPMRGVEPPTY